MPVFCDEGVFHTVASIQSDTFTADINGIFGRFHYAKILPHCNGCYISNCDLDDAVIEAEGFMKRTLIEILTESHY